VFYGRSLVAALKYKNIDSALHNFGQSFMSLMNYLDDGYVVDDVLQIVKAPPHELSINFSTGEVSPPGDHPVRLLRSTQRYRDDLPKHLERHNIDAGAVKEVRLVHRLTRKGHETTMTASDDRGKEHSVEVRMSW
jgi:hypothetical protein